MNGNPQLVPVATPHSLTPYPAVNVPSSSEESEVSDPAKYDAAYGTEGEARKVSTGLLVVALAVGAVCGVA
ncbi:hypothetical protein KIPB_014796, partial [Kipferlia bialata]|eukprot:g14796.t1